MISEPESVADWYLRRGLEFSYAGRIREILYLVAAEKITACEVVKFIEIWGLEEGPKTATWRVWVSEVRKIAAARPDSFICLAPSDDNPSKLIVAASIQSATEARTATKPLPPTRAAKNKTRQPVTQGGSLTAGNDGGDNAEAR